ncbi:MAG: DnaA/Hda family protein [Planctomycetota bacterium]
MTAIQTQRAIGARLARRLETDLGPRKFQMWFASTARFDYLADDQRIRVAVPTTYHADRMERQYRGAIESAVNAECDAGVPVDIVVDEALFDGARPNSTPPADEPATATPHHTPASPHSTTPPAHPNPQPAINPTARPKRTALTGLDAGYPLANAQLRHRLEQFIVGPSNQLAYAAACRLAEAQDTPQPDTPAVPDPLLSGTQLLFLPGGCGTGKTHLVQGLCRRLLENHPRARLVYTTGEQFTNSFIHAIQTNTLPAFRRRIRNLDLLAVDDVHFLAAKEKTQQEFLHCFNEIELSGARVVLASDCHPRLIHSFSEPLINRCLRGMVVQVEQPDAETRRSLMRALAMRMGMVLQPAALELLVQRCDGSVREMEGQLTKLYALASISGSRGGSARGVGNVLSEPIGHALVDRLLRGVPGRSLTPARPVRFADVVDVVCSRFGLEKDHLLGRSRHAHIVTARSLVAYLLHRLAPMSYPEIARAMGKKNHSGVLAAARRIEERRLRREDVRVPTCPDPVPLESLIRELTDAVRDRL